MQALAALLIHRLSVEVRLCEAAALQVARARQAGCAQRHIPTALTVFAGASAAQSGLRCSAISSRSASARPVLACASGPGALCVQGDSGPAHAPWHHTARRACASRTDKADAEAQHNTAPAEAHKADERGGGLFGTAASGLGIFGAAAFFSKRAIMVLGGKSVWGLFKIVSLKKFVFLPAWLWVMAASGGALLPRAVAYRLHHRSAQRFGSEAALQEHLRRGGSRQTRRPLRAGNRQSRPRPSKRHFWASRPCNSFCNRACSCGPQGTRRRGECSASGIN